MMMMITNLKVGIDFNGCVSKINDGIARLNICWYLSMFKIYWDQSHRKYRAINKQASILVWISYIYIVILFLGILFLFQFYVNPYPEPNPQAKIFLNVQKYINIAFTILFTIECVLKLLGFGLKVQNCIMLAAAFCWVSSMLVPANWAPPPPPPGPHHKEKKKNILFPFVAHL